MESDVKSRGWACGTRRRARCGVLSLAVAFVAVLVSSMAASSSARAQSYSLLYSFRCGTDGAYDNSGVVRDAAGNLYGTTTRGGTYGNGAVYELSASGTETVLHSFGGNPTDGYYPVAALVRDATGNLFGTTVYGGAFGGGAVFKVTASGAETILYSFTGGADGDSPNGLVEDKAGNLYGATVYGGASGNGVVFKLTPGGVETVLHSFAGPPADGTGPAAALVRDTTGNLYGTTYYGGASGDGIVFKVTASGVETVLHSFTGTPGDGSNPAGGLIRDTAGDLFGSTSFGGTSNIGTVFEISAGGVESLRHEFTGGTTDGNDPAVTLAGDSAGNLYGTTLLGGAGSFGVVYELSKTGTQTILHSFNVGIPNDGHFSYSRLALDGTGSIYGTTYVGGVSRCGAVFKYTP